MDLKIFKTHRPTDSSDPGFTIPGAKLRWISGRVRERSDSSGLWIPLRKSAMPKELVTHIDNHYPGAFSEGDTIRRGSGELILAYSSVEAANKHRAELNQRSIEQASRAKIMPKQEAIGRNDFAKITEYEAEASSIPSQFLGKQNKE